MVLIMIMITEVSAKTANFKRNNYQNQTKTNYENSSNGSDTNDEATKVVIVATRIVILVIVMHDILQFSNLQRGEQGCNLRSPWRQGGLG